MSYEEKRLRRLEKKLIPEAIAESIKHPGQYYYRRNILDLIKERDLLKEGRPIKGLIKRLRNLDRFALTLPIALMLNSCMTNTDLRDIKNGYIDLFSVSYSQGVTSFNKNKAYTSFYELPLDAYAYDSLIQR